MKSTLHDQAVLLRKQGYSYSHISAVLGIGKGTLSYWLTDIPYVPNAETLATVGLARANSSVTKNKRKQESISVAQKQARKEIGTISKRDLFMLGIGLYIGEGTKTHDQIRVANSDSKVIAFMIRWFRAYGVPEDHFMARAHIYPDTDEKKVVAYWSKATGLAKERFHKSYVDRRVNKTRNMAGKLPFGTLHLTIREHGKKEFGSLFARKIKAWMDVVLTMRD